MLTGSVSWDLESPCLFDHFEVATWAGYDLLSIKETSMDTKLKSPSPCNRGYIPMPLYITPVGRVRSSSVVRTDTALMWRNEWFGLA